MNRAEEDAAKCGVAGVHRVENEHVKVCRTCKGTEMGFKERIPTRWKATPRKTKVVLKGTEAKSGKVLTHAMTMNYGRWDQLVICTRLNHERE